jgi:hypothetical protein
MSLPRINPTLRAIGVAIEASSEAEVSRDSVYIEKAIEEWSAVVRDSSGDVSLEIQASILSYYAKALMMRWSQNSWRDDIDDAISAFESAEQKLHITLIQERYDVYLGLATAYYERYASPTTKRESDILNACRAWEEAYKLFSNGRLDSRSASLLSQGMSMYFAE